MIYRDQLEAVYRLIEKPENWTQDVLARNSSGGHVSPEAPTACSWCLIGAFKKFGFFEDWVGPTHLLLPGIDVDELIDSGAPGGAAYFNDTHTHAEVLELLKSAIERAPVRP